MLIVFANTSQALVTLIFGEQYCVLYAKVIALVTLI